MRTAFRPGPQHCGLSRSPSPPTGATPAARPLSQSWFHVSNLTVCLLLLSSPQHREIELARPPPHSPGLFRSLALQPLVRGSWKQLCEADAFSQRTPGRTWGCIASQELGSGSSSLPSHSSSHIQPLRLLSLGYIHQKPLQEGHLLASSRPQHLARPCIKVLENIRLAGWICSRKSSKAKMGGGWPEEAWPLRLVSSGIKQSLSPGSSGERRNEQTAEDEGEGPV